MGYGITAYVVDGELLRRSIGSREHALVARILTDLADEVADLDEGFADEIAGGAPDMARALGELIDRAFSTPQHGFAYVYALELLCQTLGTRMSNEALGRFGNDGAALVDRALAAAGAKLTVTELTDWAPPVEMPRPDGLPGCTTVAHDRAALLAPALEAVDIDSLAPSGEDDENEFVRDAMGELLEWVTAARDLPAGVVVCFYY